MEPSSTVDSPQAEAAPSTTFNVETSGGGSRLAATAGRGSYRQQSHALAPGAGGYASQMANLAPGTTERTAAEALNGETAKNTEEPLALGVIPDDAAILAELGIDISGRGGGSSDSDSDGGETSGETERTASESGGSAAAAALSGGGVATVIRGGSTSTKLGDAPTPSGDERTAYSIVQPGGTPTLGSSENTCLPSTSSAVLAWEVVDGGDKWCVSVTSLTLAGQVNVKPWPSKPNEMVTKNTPNPVDGGNINNTENSNNHWKVARENLDTYNKSGGGAGPHWHDTAASKAHEWAHGNTDYIKDSVSSSAGGNWPDVNKELDKLSITKGGGLVSAEVAKAALQKKVDALLKTWRSKTISRWNAIPDSPGAAGGAGYVAGQKVLDKHITKIDAYAKEKGWS